MTDDKDSLNRSRTVKKNAYYSLGLKIVGFSLSFLTLPLTLHYLSTVEYGVWITLFSIMNWINMLDIGIGLGMRNKLAYAISLGDNEGARYYISTGLFSIATIGAILLILTVTLASNINMQYVFNTVEIDSHELYIAVLWTGIFLIASFVLGIINQIYYAYQKAAVTGLISVVNGILLLGIIYVLTLQENHSLTYFVFGFGIAIVLSKVIFWVLFFREHKEVIPSWQYVRFSGLKEITNLGIKFFIIQLCSIIGFSFSNVLITQLLGPEYVRTYDVIFKLFNISVAVQGLIVSPLWSAYTDAYAKKDYVWMKRIFWKSLYISGVITIGMLVVALFIDDLLYLWLSMYFDYSAMLIIGMIVYHMLSMISYACCMLVNGIGRLTMQMYGWFLEALLLIPSTFFFTHYLGMNIEGVIWALNVSTSVLVCMLLYDIRCLFTQWKKSVL